MHSLDEALIRESAPIRFNTVFILGKNELRNCKKKKNRLGAHYLLMEFIAYFVLTVETAQTALFTVYDHPVKSPPPLPPYTSSLILENVPSSLCELSSITTVDSTTTSQTADVNHKVLYLHCPKLITIDRAETSITSTSNSLVQLVIKAAHKSDRRLRTDQSDKPHQRSRTSAKLPCHAATLTC